MIRTIHHWLKSSARPSAPVDLPWVFTPSSAAHERQHTSAAASEKGETLIEVMFSALIVALIVVAMFNGFDVSNRATNSERARAQADTLAQQAEDKLRGLSISTLKALESKSRVEEITQGGTTYTITSTVQSVADATATASCNSSSAGGSYLRTTSTVTWASLGTRSPVVETGLISPPPGSALIVQVTDEFSEGVAGANVTATGPAPSTAEYTLTTAANGCAILALLPGEYNINVAKTGYVDENWFASSAEDPHSTHNVYLVAETAVKEPYRFAPAGSLEVKFKNGTEPSIEGDSFVAFNSGMSTPAFRQIGTLEKYKVEVTTGAKVFPFTPANGYIVYAGSCEQNNPRTVNPENAEPKPVVVPSGGKVVAQVIEPPVKIRVMSGTAPGKLTEGSKVENATGTLVEPNEPEGCGTTRKFTSTPKGGLPHPGMPFGEYTLCVTAAKRKYTTTFENDLPAGPSKLSKMTNGGVVEGAAVIYMGAAIKLGELEEGEKCP